MLDVDGVLRFLALEIALVNTDGYWTRASDYNIYQDERGRFHVHPARRERSVRGRELRRRTRPRFAAAAGRRAAGARGRASSRVPAAAARHAAFRRPSAAPRSNWIR